MARVGPPPPSPQPKLKDDFVDHVLLLELIPLLDAVIGADVAVVVERGHDGEDFGAVETLPGEEAVGEFGVLAPVDFGSDKGVDAGLF